MLPPPRLACMLVKRRSTGAADAVIMPTIITDHIAKVKKKSRAPHGALFAISIFAITVVETAEDGVEAVLKLGVGDYDAVILDLMMPHLDGFALIDTLAANDPSRLKRVIVTSAASPAVIQARMRGKPFDILPKPFDIEDLQRRVRACVEQES